MTHTSTRRPVKPRPRLHFTADEGWINDPYGIAWTDGQYHLYYQAVPGQVVWGPSCHWGHAVSEDLVHWREHELALIPQDFEIGCWSGSVVHDSSPPTMFYTRVAGENWEIGQVALAHQNGDGQWRSAPDSVVIPAPPADLAVNCFRDPFVFGVDDGWAMLMAAALDDGSGAVLHYRSTDLKTWTYDGVLCSRRSDPTDDVWTGTLWECPQLFPLDDKWVLLVSVWHEQTLHYVAAAVGDYDGHRFTPHRWQRLTYGSSAYAMTAFTDRDGQPCVLSWLREEPQNDDTLSRRAGAHSIVSTIDLTATGELVLRPHPNVVDLLWQPVADSNPPNHTAIGPDPATLTVAAGEDQTITIHDNAVRAELRVTAHTLTVTRPDLPDGTMPLGAGEVQILLDADLLEVFSTSTYGAFRIAPAADDRTTAITATGTIRTRRLPTPR